MGFTKSLTLGASLLASVRAQDEQICSFEVGSPVKTTSGTVHGHRAPNATLVSEYLGIPYAQPPLGNLRFAPPQPHTSSSDIQATNYGHDCPSMSAEVPTFLDTNVYNILANLGQVGDDQQEDCLTINVWSKPQSGVQKKPVLVWIYGGGFNAGGTNSSAYSGQFWADDEDVVFVNFNYRLNIFGFPGGPSLTQNLGLLDQRLAIEWVRDNIEAFGGDPERITIFGQSAGGASVDYYNYAWTEDPIIAGSILMSGTASSFGNKLPETAADAWYEVAENAGCPSRDAGQEAVLECMRKVSMETLIEAESAGSGLASVRGRFGPTVDNQTVFYDYTARALNQNYIQKPSIIGNNAYEAGLFILITAGSNLTIPQYQWDAFNYGEFICPAATAAQFRHGADIPVWRYIYNGVFPNTELPTSTGRAWHGAEILPLFGSSEEITKVDSTWQERALGNYMRSAWAAFARCPESALSSTFGWPVYSNDTRTLLQLGYDDANGTRYEVAPRLNTSMAIDSCGMFPYGGMANQ